MESRVRAENERREAEKKEIESKKKQKELELEAKRINDELQRQKALEEVEAAAKQAVSSCNTEQVGGGPWDDICHDEILKVIPTSADSGVLDTAGIMNTIEGASNITFPPSTNLELRLQNLDPIFRGVLGKASNVSRNVPPELDLLFGSGRGRLAIEYVHE